MGDVMIDLDPRWKELRMRFVRGEKLNKAEREIHDAGIRQLDESEKSINDNIKAELKRIKASVARLQRKNIRLKAKLKARQLSSKSI